MGNKNSNRKSGEEENVNRENAYAMEKLKSEGGEDQPDAPNPAYGKSREYDPNFKGPTASRSCTDLPCLLLFLLAIVGHVAVAVFAFRNGNPKILLRPTDFQGNVCGYGPRINHTHLLFFDLMKCARQPAELVVKGCGTPQVCIKECPTKNWIWMELHTREEALGTHLNAEREADMYCQEGFKPHESSYSVKKIVEEKLCAPYYLESADFFGRCVPKLATDIANATITKVYDSNGTVITLDQLKNGTRVLGNYFGGGRIPANLLSDLSRVWQHLLVFMLIGTGLCFLWCMILQFFACIFVYLTLSSFFIGFASSTVYCVHRYLYRAPNTIDWSNLVISPNVNYYLNFKETWLAFAIISSIVTLIVLLILVCLCAQIRLAITLLGEATKAVAGNVTTLVFPIIPFCMEMITLAFWVAVAIHLASVGQPVFYHKENKTQMVANVSDCYLAQKRNRMACYFVKYSGSDWALYLHLYNIFMGFWLSCYVAAFGEMVLAGTFALWYWSFNKSKDLPPCPLLKSIWRALFYHAGSLAFGSLIIATTKFIRFTLELMQRNMQGSQNPVTKFFFCCCKCCFWCLEQVLKFLNKNAYIMIAIHGHSFIFAAKDAFFLIMRNILRVAVLNGVTSFILAVGKLLMSGTAAALAFLFFDHQLPYTADLVPQLNYLWVPVAIVFVATWIVATLFFSVFDFAVDTLFLCVMEDLERNDGSEERPYFMSLSLQETLNKRNVASVESKRSGCGICCCC